MSEGPLRMLVRSKVMCGRWSFLFSCMQLRQPLLGSRSALAIELDQFFGRQTLCLFVKNIADLPHHVNGIDGATGVHSSASDRFCMASERRRNPIVKSIIRSSTLFRGAR